jgi:hypothetical protein
LCRLRSRSITSRTCRSKSDWPAHIFC